MLSYCYYYTVKGHSNIIISNTKAHTVSYYTTIIVIQYTVSCHTRVGSVIILCFTWFLIAYRAWSLWSATDFSARNLKSHIPKIIFIKKKKWKTNDAFLCNQMHGARSRGPRSCVYVVQYTACCPGCTHNAFPNDLPETKIKDNIID